MEYDAIGRVTKQTLADGHEISYSYDANGNLVALTPPGKPSHFFDHTPVNLTSMYLPPEVSDSTGLTTYDYNLDRQLVSTAFSDSSLIQVVYDTSSCGCSGGSKPLQIITPTCTTDFKYSTSTGKLVEIQGKRLGVSGERLDTLRFTYDGSLPLSVEWAGSVDGRVDVSYNNDFKVVSQSVNNANTVGFSYDDDGLLTQAGDLSISYNSQNGMLTGTSLGSISTGYGYNAYGELASYSASYSGSDLFNTFYTLDDIGRITGISEVVLGDINDYVYDYDLSGRLSTVSRNDTLISQYFYDDNGNRVLYIAKDDTVRGVYDDQDRMLSYGNTTYEYNARGSLTFKAENGDTTFYTYDLMGNLTDVTLPNGDLIEYLIDAQNRRVGKKLNGAVQKQWIYQDQLNPIAEFDGSGSLISRFVYGNKGHVPAYMVKNDSTYRFITDHLGSVRLVVNEETGAIVQQISYDEFGNVLSNSNPDFQPFAYAGGLYDTDTELIRFGARDYDASVGRWTCKESLKFAGGFNFYTYVSNNPINQLDINGLYELQFNFETQTIQAVITNKGETLWNLAERLTGDGSRWKDIGDPCDNIDPTKIQIGDKFDVTGLFDQAMLNKIFYSQNDDSFSKWDAYAVAGLLMGGNGFIGIGTGMLKLYGLATTGVLAASTGYIIVGGVLILIAVDIAEGNGADKTAEFFDFR